MVKDVSIPFPTSCQLEMLMLDNVLLDGRARLPQQVSA